MADYWVYIAVCGCVLQAVFICFEYAEKYTLAVIFKGTASIMFVLLGFAFLSVTKDALFGWLVAAGLIFGAIGDVLLNLYKLAKNGGNNLFMAGIAAFFTGHLIYIAALLGRGVSALFIAAPLCAVAAAILIPLILKRIEVRGKLKIFGVVYMTLVFLMAGCAAGLLVFQPYNNGHLLFTAGAALFALSDVILVLHLFGVKKHRTFRALNLTAYYFGQILIALSLLLLS